MHFICKKLFVVLILSFAFNAFSNESNEDWFQIEYVVFEHLNSDKSILRYEDTLYKPLQDIQYQYIYAFGEPMSPYQYEPMDLDQTDLGDAIKQLKRSQETRVIDHAAWQQVIDQDSQTLPLIVKAGARYFEDQFELEGTITIRRSRYMHADVDLFLSEFTATPYSDLADWFFQNEEDRWPAQWLVSPLAYTHPVLEKTGKSFVASNTYHLNHSRRVRDAETHYIDHPAIGMIVTIKAIENPNALEEDYEEIN